VVVIETVAQAEQGAGEEGELELRRHEPPKRVRVPQMRRKARERRRTEP
jgi:hypothetical protein